MEYYRFKEKNECAYTIDWFTLEFHLLLSLAQWEELEEAVKSLGEKSKDYSSKSGTKLKGKYHHYRAYQIGGLAAYTTKHYGVPLCANCAQKRKDAATAAAASQEEQPTPSEETVAETEEVL